MIVAARPTIKPVRIHQHPLLLDILGFRRIGFHSKVSVSRVEPENRRAITGQVARSLQVSTICVKKIP